MRMRYDPESGALYFRLREGDIEETAELETPGAYMDLDSEGRVMGLEFLSVHEFLGFLVAMGGKVSIPERVGRIDSPSVDPASFADAAREGYRGATDPALDTQKSNVRLSRSFFENWVETLEDLADLKRREEEALETLTRANEEVRREEEEDQANEPLATEAARRKAEELGVDLSRIEGTGAQGRITVRDVIGVEDRDRP
jgi:pyruvate/2-oxoglutarate dehydrogenase complex dihydrolipoamide acyltransferase (E2) component